MEPQGLVSEASWSCFDPAMSVEESEVMAQLLGSHSFAGDHDQPQQMLWSDHNADSYYCAATCYHDPYCWPQGNCSSSGTTATNYYYLSDPHMVPAMGVSSTPMSFSIGGERIDAPSFPVGAHHQFGTAVCVTEEASSDRVVDSLAKPLAPPAHASQAVKRRLHGGGIEVAANTEEDDAQLRSPKKKARASAPMPQKGKKNAESNKAQKSGGSCNEEESNGDMNPQSSCCYTSEDDSNGSQELKGAAAAALNPNGKTRAGRGSATDPQSLYARKRRERINERLKILQTLVPNGTKVDISTMLEEAVQYVKFLQLQIKLLSSDELWMYAPIAYNGMNLGIDLNIASSKSQH